MRTSQGRLTLRQQKGTFLIFAWHHGFSVQKQQVMVFTRSLLSSPGVAANELRMRLRYEGISTPVLPLLVV